MFSNIYFLNETADNNMFLCTLWCMLDSSNAHPTGNVSPTSIDMGFICY